MDDAQKTAENLFNIDPEVLIKFKELHEICKEKNTAIIIASGPQSAVNGTGRDLLVTWATLTRALINALSEGAMISAFEQVIMLNRAVEGKKFITKVPKNEQ